MCDIFNFLWDQGAQRFVRKEKQNWSIVFIIKNIFIELPDLKLVSKMIMYQMSQLTRYYMWKCYKSKYLSNNGRNF